MNQGYNSGSYGNGAFASQIDLAAERTAFVQKVYLHLLGAIGLFAVFLAAFVKMGVGFKILELISGTPIAWLAFLGGFALVGWLARGFAASSTSKSSQYLGLVLYTLAEALIFSPLMAAAIYMQARIGEAIVFKAVIMTAALFLGLTGVVLVTRKDFSFLRGILMVGGFIALGLIVCGMIFGFDLGLWFCVGMVVLAAGSILYDTSNILLHFPTDRYVGASLELFASVALLFWYILLIVMRFSRR